MELHHDNVNGSTDGLLVEAMREYQAALDAGAAPDRAAFLAQHAPLTRELADCLDGLHFLRDHLPPAEPSAISGVPLGDFRMIRELGRGGMGVVYEVEQLSLGRRVALKVLPFAATLDARQLQRFRTEATAAAHLHHPNIVQVYGVGYERGVHYYAMELIEGQTLAQIISDCRWRLSDCTPARRSDAVGRAEALRSPREDQTTGFEDSAGSTNWAHRREDQTGGFEDSTRPTSRVHRRELFRTAARWGVQAAAALEHAHQLGIIHRDIKPANLLVDRHGSVHVTDFGLAHVGTGRQMTRTGDMIGTLRYMSPEQARGESCADPRTDVYSLGVTLYQLLTGKLPLDAENRQALLRQILEDEPTPIVRLQPAVPAELAVIVHKALAKSPQDRYASAQEMADDLQAWLDDRPIRARPPSLTQRIGKWARRHHGTVGIAIVCSVLMSAALLVSTVVVAAKHEQVVGALARTNSALKSESEVRAKLAETLSRETHAAYGYRLPLAKRAWREADARRARQLLDECPEELRGWEWSYLERRVADSYSILQPAGQRPPLDLAIFSTDQQTILASSRYAARGSLLMRSWHSGSLRSDREFWTPLDSGDRLELSPDGRYVAVFDSATTTVQVYDVASRQLAFVLEIDSGATVVRFSFDGRDIAVGSKDGTISVYRVNDGSARWTQCVYRHPIADVAWAPNGKTLVASAVRSRAAPRSEGVSPSEGNANCQSQDLCALEAATGRELWRQSFDSLLGPNRRTSGLRFSPQGQFLLAPASLTVGPLVVDAKSGAQVHVPPDAAVRAISPDDRRAFAIMPDRTATIFDLGTSQPTVTWKLNEPSRTKRGSFELNRSRCPAAFSPNGERIAFAHDDGRISVWSAHSGQELVTLPGAAKATHVSFDAAGDSLLTATIDRSIVVWHINRALESRLLAADSNHAKYIALAASPDGRSLAALRVDATRRDMNTAAIELWDLEAGRCRSTIAAPIVGCGWAMPGMGSMQMSADGTRISTAGIVRSTKATGEFQRICAAWDVTAGKTIFTTCETAAVAKQFVLLETETAMPPMDLDQFRSHFDPMHRVRTLSVPGTAMHSDEPLPITIADAHTGATVWNRPDDGSVRWAVASPDGHYCAVVQARSERSGQPALELWDVATNRRLWQLASESTAVLTATFSPDGRRILTQPIRTGDDARIPWQQSAVIWDTATGRAISNIALPTLRGAFGEPMHSRFIFSTDGTRLFEFGARPGLIIWDADAGRELLVLGESSVIVEAVFLPGGRLVTRGHDGAIRVWDGRPFVPK